MHAIVIDQSDKISEQQQQQVRQYLDRILLRARAGERFDLYVADSDAAHSTFAAISICSPGRGADANALYQNPKRIQARFEERFVKVLHSQIDQMLLPSERSESPILETIRAVAISSFGSVDGDATPLRLTLISDMVQNSKLYSQFKGATSFSDLEREPRWKSLQANLANATVYILYLHRPSAVNSSGAIQTRGHQLFWEQAIRASGGTLLELEAY